MWTLSALSRDCRRSEATIFLTQGRDLSFRKFHMALYCDVNALQKFAEIAFLSKIGCYLANALSFRKFHADSIEEKQASFQAVSLQERKEHPEIV